MRPQSEKLSKRLADNIRELDRQFGLETNFDVLKGRSNSAAEKRPYSS